MYENIDKMQYTPMMRQYLTIKEKHQDALVFFRLGDFYEMFFNDAIIASKELDIVLTKRDAGSSEKVPMCGVPSFSIDSYIEKLTKLNYKVCVVEQLEDPKNAKGIVLRDVVRIITPGTAIELNTEEFNYLTSISKEKDYYILAYCDLSTGANYITNIPLNNDFLYTELIKLKTKEIVISSSFNKDLLINVARLNKMVISIEDNTNEIAYMNELLTDLTKEEKEVFNRLLNYITNTQKRVLVHMQKVIKYQIDSYLKIDYNSRRSLELVESIKDSSKKNTLFGILDKCVTSIGSRYLKRNIMYPLIDIDILNSRYNVITKMQKSFLELDELRKALSGIYDFERILGKISYENANPRDLLQLSLSLNKLDKINELIKQIKLNEYDLSDLIIKIKPLINLLYNSIKEDCPLNLKDGGIIKDLFNNELDELRNIKNHGQEYLLELEAKEKEKTGIKTLKVGYNRVFGYYFEVPKGSVNLVKDEFNYIRKQTISTGERYINSELKEKESLILRSSEKAIEIEIKLFNDIRNTVKTYINSIQLISKIISEIDMLSSFSIVSKENNYVKPKLNNENIIDIKGGRHPVVEAGMSNFISNDLKMKDESIILITGPNMSGKSTYMRQTALIAIMAQIGCFVSCSSCNIKVFDAIYTRIGASDDLVSGQSTFMVEMNEVNNALTYATKDSLLLFDEIGRGTATYDGIALAQAILEYLHQHNIGKTLFSTHYHELTILDESLENLSNVYVSASEVDGDIVFLHKVLKGSVDRSYGINVAKLANIPLDVILRAKDLLSKLESNKSSNLTSHKYYQPPLVYDSKTEKETNVLKRITELDVYQMSPIEALNLLNELQKILKK